jgi:hypothetical protein
LGSYVVFVRIRGERVYSYRVDNARDEDDAKEVVRTHVANTLEIQGGYSPDEVGWEDVLDATAGR